MTADIIWRLEQSFDTRLTYQLLDRRFEEAETLSAMFTLGEAELVHLRKEIEAASKLPASQARSEKLAHLGARTMRVADDMRTAQRQAKRVQQEIMELTADLTERAKSVVPEFKE